MTRSIQRKVTIEISLVKESKKITDNEILKEISDAFSNEEFVIPWCEKVEKISLSYG